MSATGPKSRIRRYPGPTQKLRDMLADLSWGGGGTQEELHAELDKIEKAFGLLVTEPTDD